MPNLRIRLINSTFNTVADASPDYDADAVLAEGREGAIGIVADELRAGANSVILHVIVEEEGGRQIKSIAVSASVVNMTVEDQSLR